MHTNIDQFDERTGKRAKRRPIPTTNDLVRHTEWLLWPILSWGGAPDNAHRVTDSEGHTLHSQLVAKLCSLPAGLFALHLVTGTNRNIRLLPINAERLATTTHALATANHAASKAPREDKGSFVTRPRLHAHLAQLGSRLNALRSFPLEGARKPLLRQCWRVSATDVLPPTAIDAALEEFTEIYRDAARLAAMEYILSASNTDLSRFCSALKQLFTECRCAIAEPERRHGIFLSLIKETEALCPAYLQHIFSSRTRSRITKLEPNPAFPPLVVEAFFRDYLPAKAAACFSPENKARFGFEEVAEWLVGTKLPAFKKGTLIESDSCPDVAAHLRESLRSLAKSPAGPWLNHLATLAGHCAAVGDDPEIPEQLAAWLKACRIHCKQTSDGASIWNVAVTCLERLLDAADGTPENIRLLCGLLSSRGAELVCLHQFQKPSSDAFWKLGAMGTVPLKTVTAIIDLDLVESATNYFTEKPERLKEFTALVEQHRSDWDQLPPYRKRLWTWLFTKMESAALLAKVLQWRDELLSTRKFAFAEVDICLLSLERFLTKVRSNGERKRRESFLSENMPLLERILDESEQCRKSLPEKGFECWKTPAALWSSRFSTFEFAYQWHEAKFSTPAMLVEAIFEWQRYKQREDIAHPAEWSPWNCDVDHNEALVVRLSGGKPKQLLALLQFRIENWYWPDNPLKGWLFLDRFPAIQHFLVELCTDTSGRLRESSRVLLRIALALRLQCRQSLQVGFEAWETASAIEEPIEALTAFANLIRPGHPFPDAIQRIFAREERLRGEHEALCKMRDAESLSHSALRRIAKLDRLVQQPDRIAEWARRDARKAIVKRLPDIKMHLLNLSGRRTLREHWRQVLRAAKAPEGVHWDHALRFYYTADKNKDILRKLLRHLAQGDRQWRLLHPPNA